MTRPGNLLAATARSHLAGVAAKSCVGIFVGISSSSSNNSTNISVDLMMREDDGKEALVEEAYAETKEEPCRSSAAVGRGGMARERQGW